MQVEDEEKLRRFNSQWDKAHTTEGGQPQTQGNQVVSDDNSQGLMDSIKSTIMNPSPYAPTDIPTTGNRCPECNLLHPPLPPGQVCPNGSAKAEVIPVTPPQSPAALSEPTQEVHSLPDDAVESLEDESVKPAPPAPQPVIQTTSELVVPEPAPLAENNIPSEIHINKYLNSWSDMIKAHCQRRGTTNIKKLMRHLTIEIMEFLENYERR